MQTQYDPYGSPKTGSTVSNFITAPIRPSTYIGMYGMFPGMWSPSKGIWIPGIGKSIAGKTFPEVLTAAKGRISSAVKSSIADPRSILPKTTSKAIEAGKRLSTFGHRGGGFVGTQTLNKLQLADDLYNNIYKETLKRNLNTGISKTVAKDAAKATAEQGLKNVGKGLSGVSVKKGFLGAGVRPSYLGPMKLGTKYDAIRGVSNLAKKRILGKVARGALSVAKVGAGVMGALAVKDMIDMVAVPLGQLAVRTLNDAANRYQQRFMPEMGGDLQLSYLSRGAATERQRAVEAISKSRINGRAAIGNEAFYMHQ
jgi:hypothetical protein